MVRYVHQDSLSGTSVMSDSGGSSVGSIKYLPYGGTRSGSVPTDRKFTGQRLDDTGLYYYGARYYDPTIGKFISADTIVQAPNNPQSLNRYSYVINNPLAYTDPTGNCWGPARGICNRVKSLVVDAGKVVAKGTAAAAKTVAETVQTSLETQGKASIVEAQANQALGQVVNDVITSSIGVEDVSRMSTSLVQDVPVIDIRQGSLLDKVLPNTVTLYPLGVFTNDSMRPDIQEEEGFHWKDQSNWGPFVTLWYYEYVFEYGLNYVAYGFDPYLAHDAVSFERDAMSHAGTGGPPPPP